MGWIAVFITALIFFFCLWLEVQRLTIKPWPPKTFFDAESEFKYGSIGAEVTGFPYLIWRELPSIYHTELPEGWAEFGFITESQQPLPIGISVRRTGVDRVGFNCATCHTARLRVGDAEQLILGAPAEQLDLQAYLRFLIRVSADPKLTADAVIGSAKENERPLSWIDQQILRYFVFPGLRVEAANLAQSFAWMNVKPRHGPGRTDAGNVWRQRWGMRPERDELVGTVDFPSVWNQQIRQNGWFHWDGNNSSLTERNYSAALAGGAAEWLLERRAIGKVSDWLLTLKPPRLPGQRNVAAVEQGKVVYERAQCAQCHEAGGRLGQVTDIDVVRTDSQRADLFTPAMVTRFHQVGRAYSWQFKHYRSSHGYSNMPLDGIWARAPYLHNGSVPTLAALLSPPVERPVRFLRGCATYDPVNVGYDCQTGVLFDTKQNGNGNGGHLWGTDLPAADKVMLLEYLRSL